MGDIATRSNNRLASDYSLNMFRLMEAKAVLASATLLLFHRRENIVDMWLEIGWRNGVRIGLYRR